MESEEVPSAQALSDKLGCAVLLTGGHAAMGSKATDVLWHDGTATKLEAPWIETSSAHGTGCTFSAALAANLALGRDLAHAARIAKTFITRALREAYGWESPPGETVRAVNQLPADPFCDP